MALQVQGGLWRNTYNKNRARLGVRTRGGPRRGAKAFRKGPWLASENAILSNYISQHGPGNWSDIHEHSLLRRSGKSCRLRWANHLRSNLRKCPFSPEEKRRIIELHFKIGNKWSQIASQLDGRTDNDIKNFWNTRLKKCKREGLPIYPLDIQQNESHNSSISIHQSPIFGNPLVPILDSFTFGSPDSPYISDVSLIKPIHDNYNNNFLNPSFPRAPPNMPYCNQVLPTPYFTNVPFQWNDAFFYSVDLSQNETPSPQEKGKCIDYSGRMEDSNVLNLKLNFKVGNSDVTKTNHLDNFSSDNSSCPKMGANTDSFEGMTVIDDELAALLDFWISAPTLDWCDENGDAPNEKPSNRTFAISNASTSEGVDCGLVLLE